MIFTCMHNFLELDSFLVQQLDHLLLGGMASSAYNSPGQLNSFVGQKVQ